MYDNRIVFILRHFCGVPPPIIRQYSHTKLFDVSALTAGRVICTQYNTTAIQHNIREHKKTTAR